MVASKAATGLFAKGAASQALGHVLQFAGKAAMAPGKLFSSVTKGVTSTLTEFTKTAAAKMGVDVPTAAANFFGEGSALSRAGESFAAPFSAKAQASITAKRAEQLFSKEGLTFDLEKLTKVSEEVNTGSFLGGDIPGGMELYDGSQQVKVTSDVSSPIYETGQFSDMPDFEQYMKTSTPVKEQSLLEKSFEKGAEKVVEEVETFAGNVKETTSDPIKFGQKTLEFAQERQQEKEQEAAFARPAQVIEFDPFAYDVFSSFDVPSINTVAPLQTFKVSDTDQYQYQEPATLWGKQIQMGGP